MRPIVWNAVVALRGWRAIFVGDRGARLHMEVVRGANEQRRGCDERSLKNEHAKRRAGDEPVHREPPLFPEFHHDSE